MLSNWLMLDYIGYERWSYDLSLYVFYFKVKYI